MRDAGYGFRDEGCGINCEEFGIRDTSLGILGIRHKLSSRCANDRRTPKICFRSEGWNLERFVSHREKKIGFIIAKKVQNLVQPQNLSPGPES